MPSVASQWLQPSSWLLQAPALARLFNCYSRNAHFSLRVNVMEIVYIVIALALLQFFVFGGLVGRARVKYGVDAPAVTGHPIFERYHRVHYNTMEQLVIFIPSVFIFGKFISPTVASGLGLLFVVGRVVYLRGYVEDPPKRGLGFGLTMLSVTILLLGGLGGAIWFVLSGSS